MSVLATVVRNRVFVAADVQQAGSLLQLFASALTEDEAAPFSMGQVADISNNAGASIFEYVSRACWDEANEKIRFLGVQHTAGWAQYCEYDALSNSWIQELVPDGRTDPRHAYSGVACTDVGVLAYHEGNTGNTLWKRTAGGAWTSHTNPQSGWANVEWHPMLSRFVIGQVWGIRTFNPADNAFAVLRNNPSGTDMSDNAGASAYSRKDQCVYVGNSSGANAAIWKVDSEGACTQISNPPVPAAVHSAGNNFAMLIGAANSSNRLLAIRQNGEAYEYDEVGDSWSTELTNVFPAALKTWIAGALNNQWVAVSIHTYGVIAFLREISGNLMDSNMYLWKH